MNYNKLLFLLLFFVCFTCDPELFPFLDAFPPSVPDDSFFESVIKTVKCENISSYNITTWVFMNSAKSQAQGTVM